MCALMDLSSRICGLSRAQSEEIIAVLEKYGLSTRLPLPAREAALEAVYDKKMEYGLINLVLLKRIGEAQIVKMSVQELVQSL